MPTDSQINFIVDFIPINVNYTWTSSTGMKYNKYFERKNN